MAIAGIENAELRLILFGGKGGVGKTSCATATAIQLSKTYKTLLISTDPAHSVSDSLGVAHENGIVAVQGYPGLSFTEIMADQAFADFKQQHAAALKALFETSTSLDGEDIDDLLTLTIPGIDEVMSLKLIIDYMEDGGFEKYVVDTAPSGHTLRLLSSPKMLDQWIKVAARMRWKYRYMITSFSGTYKQDDTDAMLLNLKKTLKKIESLLKDPVQCEFIPLCIPESMAILETARLISSLIKYCLPVRQLIVNHVAVSEHCPFCRERKLAQKKYIDQIFNNYKGLNLVLIPEFAGEIRGAEQLEKLCCHLFKVL